MTGDADKVMFEVYRQPGFNARYRVVYFTELDEENRGEEIDAALEGDHFYDGFLQTAAIVQAKAAIDAFIRRLNDGGGGRPEDLDAILAPFKPR